MITFTDTINVQWTILKPVVNCVYAMLIYVEIIKNRPIWQHQCYRMKRKLLNFYGIFFSDSINFNKAFIIFNFHQIHSFQSDFYLHLKQIKIDCLRFLDIFNACLFQKRRETLLFSINIFSHSDTIFLFIDLNSHQQICLQHSTRH